MGEEKEGKLTNRKGKVSLGWDEQHNYVMMKCYNQLKIDSHAQEGGGLGDGGERKDSCSR